MRLRIILLAWVTVRFVVNACTRPVSTPRMQQVLSEAQPVSLAPFGPPGSLAGSAVPPALPDGPSGQAFGRACGCGPNAALAIADVY